MGKHQRVTEERFWRISLTTIGALMGLVMTAFVTRPKWLVAIANTGISEDSLFAILCVVAFGGAGFVAGGVYGRFRDSLAVENAGLSSALKFSLRNIAIGLLVAVMLLLLGGFCLLPTIRT
ncbi:MAG: hypothetical protein ACM3NO_06215 [Deltaproteobacteria bacterium]